MRDMLSFHNDALEKTKEEKAITDIGPHSGRFAGSWGVLLEKGYTGIESEVRAIVPRKIPQGGMLSHADRRENEAKAIVENFFGRQCSLWAIVSNKYRWAKSSYDPIFRITVALTNLHAKWHPLRNEDGRAYERYLERLHEIVDTVVQKGKRGQAIYRCERQRMTARSLRETAEAGAGVMSDDEEEEDSLAICGASG